MNEHDLGKALLNLDVSDLSGVPDARQHAWNLLERDRRRVRRLSVVTVLIWLFAMCLIGYVLVRFALLFPEQAKFRMEVERGGIGTVEQLKVQNTHLLTFQMGTLVIAFSVAVLALAALSTFVLLTASRRATLRQINASLFEITEQLKRLRTVPG